MIFDYADGGGGGDCDSADDGQHLSADAVGVVVHFDFSTIKHQYKMIFLTVDST